MQLEHIRMVVPVLVVLATPVLLDKLVLCTVVVVVVVVAMAPMIVLEICQQLVGQVLL
jgi:hypothetical protein